MSDVIFLVITVLFLLASLGLIWVCQRLMRQ
jgi:hypothetical protein